MVNPNADRLSAQRYAERLARVAERLRASAAAALLAGPGADLEWLIGYDAPALERLTMLVLPAEGQPTVVVPRLELEIAGRAQAVQAGHVRAVAWMETEDPLRYVAAALGSTTGELLVSDHLWASFVLRLQAAFPGTSLGLASTVLGEMRMIKDAEEIELMRRAAHAADRVVAAIAGGRLVGRTESDVAREVRERLVDEGHQLASFWTVAAGENSAAPHHSDSARRIAAGEPVVFDIGGRLGGYCSDITRTIWVRGDDGSGPDDEFVRIHDIVERANQAGREAVHAGVACEAVDRAAREVISAEGYGDQFLHRTGHGIGLEVHEDPYIVAGNEESLAVGQAFSVEPGIYLEGRYGARIEDIVVCSPGGADVLNQAPRSLLVVGGR
jgi:Xaa-Pro aminopeptidase